MTAIGPFKLRNIVLLAPMAGITDAPFRALAWRFGAGYVVGEMVSSREALWHTTKSRLRRLPVDGVEPFAVQIAGADAREVAESAVRHVEDGAQVIDINFGCPVKKVCNKAAGSALLKEPELVVAIVRAAVAAVPVPVTVKMRTGWSPDLRNAVELAQRLEAEGIAAIALHGRTRACRFNGKAEHGTVAAVKSSVSIPVFANGDIDSPASARRILEETGVDGVMIGRAALGRPWLLGEVADGVTRVATLSEKLAVVSEHVAALHEFYGEPGTRIARKHVQWYLQHLTELGPKEVRSRLGKGFNRLEQAGSQLDFLAELAAFEIGRRAA